MEQLLLLHDADPSIENFMSIAQICTRRHIHSADKTIQLACVYNRLRAYYRLAILPSYFDELNLHFTRSPVDNSYLVYHANDAAKL